MHHAFATSPSASSVSRIVIGRRYRGPHTSANGGYVAGLFAEARGGCEVTLTAPPPLEAELSMAWEGERLALRVARTGKLVAYARDGEPTDPPPAAVSFERATLASDHFVGHRRHPLDECFVCGTTRDADALHLYPGRERGAEVGPLYAPWEPSANLAAPGGYEVATRHLVAALDCPGGWACLGSREAVLLLGRIRFAVVDRLFVGEPCVVVGASRGRDGRKNYADSAIYGADGRLVAHSQQTWIQIAPPQR